MALMKIIATLICLAAPAVASAQCPELPPRSETHTRLMAEVANAGSEAEARALNNQLWEIWTTAPDQTAQEILRRGMERRASYDFAGALHDFATLIDYCPHYAEGYNQRAFVNFIRGNHQQALTDLERALQITPDHIGVISGMALTLMELGQLREGQVVLREALKLNPWLPERHRLIPLDQLEDTLPETEL